MRSIHINTAITMLCQPEPVDLTVFTKDGRLLELNGCIGLKADRCKGTRRVRMTVSGQIRMIRDSLIMSVNGMEVTI